jgi:serine kinase of HPr protein (carbohydrate metabolism regulator)
MKKNFKIEEPDYVLFKDFASFFAEEHDTELVVKDREFEKIKIFERNLLELPEVINSTEGFYKGGVLYLATSAFSVLKQQEKALERLINGVNKGEIAVLVVNADILKETFDTLGDLVKKLPVVVYKNEETSYFKNRLKSYLNFCFSPFAICHGSAVEVFGEGVLVIGESGAGKSECVLELVERGHLFIADDLIKLVNYPPSSILLMTGSQSDRFKFFMEIRGVGIIDVLRTFGPSKVKVKSELAMIVEITTEDVKERSIDREKTVQIFGKPIPFFTFSVKERGLIPTRIETSILGYKLKKFGYETGKVIREVLGGESDKKVT